MKNHFYIPSSQSQRDDLPLWDLESLDNESGKTPVPANIFPQVPYDDDDFFFIMVMMILSHWLDPCPNFVHDTVQQ